MEEIIQRGLPLDVLEEIICRLPIEAFHRFRCVASLYNSLVSEYRLARKHLSYGTRHGDAHLLFITSSSSTDAQRVRACPLSCIPGRVQEGSRDTAIEVPNRETVFFREKATSMKLHDGLLCLDNYRPIFVYNLRLGTRTCVPETPEALDYLRVDTGIGYDPVDDDYIVIRLSWETPMRVWIYSLKGMRWRSVADFPRRRTLLSMCVFTGGRFHWMAKTHDLFHYSFLIVSFDPVSLEFEMTSVPRSVGEWDSARFKSIDLGGKFYVYSYRGGSYSIWETPISHASWSRVFSIPIGLIWPHHLDADEGLRRSIRPLYLYESGEVLIMTVFEETTELLVCREGAVLYKDAIIAPDDGSFVADGIVHEGRTISS